MSMNANQELSLKSRTAQKSSCIQWPGPGTIQHMHSVYESNGITLCDSLKTETSQSKLKASAVNNEPFHQNWKLYKTSWWLLRVTKANGKRGVIGHSTAYIPIG